MINGTSPQNRVASFLQGVEVGTRGDSGQISWTSPGMGRFPLSHIASFQGMYLNAASVYRDADEATKASLNNARFMRNDVGIMECLEARQRMTALLDWEILPEDEKSQEQKDLVAEMTKIIRKIRRFVEYRRVLMEAAWYGKHAIQNQYRWVSVGGNMRVLPAPPIVKPHALGWRPINGDKLVIRFDDGRLKDGQFEGQVGIRVGGMYSTGELIKQRWKIEAADRSMAYFLSPEEMKLITLHSHMIEDAAFESGVDAGAINGVGIRSRIYWEWVQKTESLRFMMEYLERSAGGMELWRYPAGNDKARGEVKDAAQNRLGGLRTVTLVPIPAGDEGNQYGVDVVEPGLGGIDILKDIIDSYFGRRIKRYILGQIQTSEGETTSQGGFETAVDTLMQIVSYDAGNLDETITHQLLRFLQIWNFPKSAHIDLRFHSKTSEQDSAEKLEAYAKLYEMGCKLKAKEVMDIVGASMPQADEEMLHKDAGQPSGGGFGGIPGGGMPDSQPGSAGDTGHGTVGDGSMGSISGNNKSPGLLAEHPTAAGLEDRHAKPLPV